MISQSYKVTKLQTEEGRSAAGHTPSQRTQLVLTCAPAVYGCACVPAVHLFDMPSLASLQTEQEQQRREQQARVQEAAEYRQQQANIARQKEQKKAEKQKRLKELQQYRQQHQELSLIHI